MPTGNPINIIERIERHAGELRDDECWETDYKGFPSGYVQISIRRDQFLLHRVAWEAHNAQPIPEGFVVMHSCDNPRCFNPLHLSVGSQQDNIDDAMSKGRMKPGPGRAQRS